MKRRLIASLVAALLATPAYAADSTVAAMTAGSAISGTDLFYCSQASGTNDRKCTGTQLGAWALGATNVAAVSGGGTTNFLRADGTWTTAGGGSPGGSNTQVQFNNSSAFGGSAGFTWDNTNLAISNLGGGTVTTSNPVINASQTWNASAVTFTGVKFNFTSTASAAASLLLDLQLGGTSVTNVNKNGAITINPQSATTFGVGYALIGVDTARYIYAPSASTLGISGVFGVSNSGAAFVTSSSQIGFSSGNITSALDTILTRPSAAIVQINGASNANGGLTLFNGATISAGEIAIPKVTASGTAPGAAGAKLSLVCGTNAGTAKIIVYGGTSTTPVTLLDNIGSGVTGC